MPNGEPSVLLPEELILRDHLAVYRTVLANERTLLSYARTSLAVMVVGGSLIGLIDDAYIEWLGVGCVALGGLVLLLGFWRYQAKRRKIAEAYRRIRP